jgi:hypothetical protein
MYIAAREGWSAALYCYQEGADEQLRQSSKILDWIHRQGVSLHTLDRYMEAEETGKK